MNGLAELFARLAAMDKARDELVNTQYTAHEDTLLAMRPFVFDRGRLCTYQGVYWPGDQRVIAPCAYHTDTIEDGCTCGIISHYSAEWALNWVDYHADGFHALGKALEVRDRQKSWSGHDDYSDITKFPILGIIQVLGKTIVDEEAKTLRSWGGFFWGLIIPPFLDKYKFHAALNFWFTITGFAYRPVFVNDVMSARTIVYSTLQHYGIDCSAEQAQRRERLEDA